MISGHNLTRSFLLGNPGGQINHCRSLIAENHNVWIFCVFVTFHQAQGLNEDTETFIYAYE